MLDQNSYDHASATNNFKHLERLVIDGFDKCSAAGGGAVQSDTVFICQHPSQNNLKPDLSKQQSSDRIKSESVNVVNHDEHGQSDDPGDDDGAEENDPGCEQPSLVAAGESKVERLGSPMINDGGRDYNVRACNQKTAGGGWTVRNYDFTLKLFYDLKAFFLRLFSEGVILVTPRRTLLGPGKIINMVLET